MEKRWEAPVSELGGRHSSQVTVGNHPAIFSSLGPPALLPRLGPVLPPVPSGGTEAGAQGVPGHSPSPDTVLPLQLALKHRQGKNHKMRIIAFVGSPVEDNEKDVSDARVARNSASGLFRSGLKTRRLPSCEIR